VPPGSDLLAQPETRDWIGPLDAESFTYRWDHPDPRMDCLHQQVAARVEQAQAVVEDPLETYLTIRELAGGIAGDGVESAGDALAIRAAALAQRSAAGKPPRL